LRRFFYPLYVKVPLQVFATFLIVGLLAYVYKTTTPPFEAARVVSDTAQVLRQGGPSAPTVEETPAAAGQGRGASLDAGRSERAETAVGDDKGASRQGPAGQPSEDREKPTGPQRLLQEREKVGVLGEQADYAQEAGESLRASRPEAPANACGEEGPFLRKNGLPPPA